VTVEHSTAASLPDSISSIKSSALRFFSGTALSRFTGMLRDTILAYCFGTHSALAALFVAYRLSQVCRRLFGEGALQSAFIPVFEELRKEESVKAFRFFRDLSYLLVLFLLGFTSLSMLGIGASLQLFDWSSGNQEILKLMIILMPSLFFICLFGLNSSLLQCQKRYFTVGIAPAFFNIIVSIGGLMFHSNSIDPVAAMPYMAVFIVLGCIAQWGVTFVPVFRTLRSSLGHSIREGVKFFSQDIRRLGGPLALGLLGVGASQINNAVDSLFARWADPQGPAQLWYSLKLLQLPLALFGIAVSGALLPPLSRSIQAGRKEEYLRFIDFALRRVFSLLAACTVGLYVMGMPLINCLYGRGDFRLDSIITTSECLHGYALGLLPMGLIIVLAPAFYAYKDFKTPAIAAFISLSINLFLNALFIFGFGMQAMSVALATSISSWINVFYLYQKLQDHFGTVSSPQGKKEAIKASCVCFFAGALAWAFQSYFFVTPSFFHLFTSHVSLPSELFEQCFFLAVPAVFFFGVLIAFSWICKANDLLALFRLKKDQPESTVQL
jgi:putative peptidoglycan lipid II flippase